jgi:hypothetical protein
MLNRLLIRDKQNFRVPRPAPGQRTDSETHVPHIARVSARAAQEGDPAEAFSKVFNAAQQQGMHSLAHIKQHVVSVLTGVLLVFLHSCAMFRTRSRHRLCRLCKPRLSTSSGGCEPNTQSCFDSAIALSRSVHTHTCILNCHDSCIYFDSSIPPSHALSPLPSDSRFPSSPVRGRLSLRRHR